MKTIILLAVICIVGVYAHHNLTPEETEKIHSHKEVGDCVAESGVSQEILDAIKNHQEFIPTRELDCFSACVLKKNGVMNEDGTINHKPTDSETKTACKNLVGKDVCATGGKVLECFARNGLIPKKN